MKHIREAIASAVTVSFSEIGNQVAEMARGVERNPDVMVWLA